jgi:hypothetical protein
VPNAGNGKLGAQEINDGRRLSGLGEISAEASAARHWGLGTEERRGGGECPRERRKLTDQEPSDMSKRYQVTYAAIDAHAMR